MVYARFRRTTLIMMGVGAFGAMALDVLAINHLGDSSTPLLLGLGLVAVVALFVMSGATPAALGLLADVSEGFEEDRSAIMGLYSVFLGSGPGYRGDRRRNRGDMEGHRWPGRGHGATACGRPRSPW
jgi:MFS family permease